MASQNIIGFLEAIDAALVPFAGSGEFLDLFLLGRSALLVKYQVGLSTKDVDVVTHGDASPLQMKAFELFGKGTPQAQALGLYLEGVPEGMPPLPARYRRAASDLPGHWQVLRPRLLNPHDLAITKLRRFHVGDREDLRILCDSGDLTAEELERALASAFPFGMDEDDDPTCKDIPGHFRKLIEYLEGRSRDLA